MLLLADRTQCDLGFLSEVVQEEQDELLNSDRSGVYTVSLQ